jgi:hypothetical protein
MRQRSGGSQFEASPGKMRVRPYLKNTQHTQKKGCQVAQRIGRACLANVRPWLQTSVPEKKLIIILTWGRSHYHLISPGCIPMDSWTHHTLPILCTSAQAYCSLHQKALSPIPTQFSCLEEPDASFSFLFFAVQGIKPRALSVLGKRSAELHSPVHCMFFYQNLSEDSGPWWHCSATQWS